MAKINIMSLGGLNENGKNLYTVSINNKILVFDCGMKYAPDKMYGVDYVIPDFSYLVDNKDKILGLFITHPHHENMGAITDLVKLIPELKVYASRFTTKILEYICEDEKVEIKNLITINPHRKIDFKEFSVFPFNVTHSCPETFGYAINTEDGAIIYMADFIIDSTMTGTYDMDIGKLAYIGKQVVLCLMAESLLAEKKGYTSPNHKLEGFFKKVIDKNRGRIIFSMLPLHRYTIQEIFNALKTKNRKVVIMGKELHSIINICIKNGYLDIDEKIIGNLTDLKNEDTIILISNDRETPYANIVRLINNRDKFITLEPTDTICFAEPSYDAYEKILVHLMNELAIHGVNIETIPKDKSVRYHASSEDLMLLMKLFNPKYYMPIKGEYRYQVINASLAEKVGIPKENILLKENGSIVEFVNGEYKDNFNRYMVDDILIDGKSSEDIGELVLKDREMLSSNGLIIISATLDKKTKKLLIGPDVVTRGFIYDKENEEILNEIKSITVKIIEENTNNKYADYVKIRNDIRERAGAYLFKETDSKPVILIVIQEMEEEN